MDKRIFHIVPGTMTKDVLVNIDDIERAAMWCIENCNSRFDFEPYYLKSYVVFKFEDPNEAMLFKLTF